MIMKLTRLLALSATACSITGILTSPALAADSPAYFADVPASSIYAQSTAYLVQHGVTSGTSDHQFSPERPITIREWAVFLSQAQGDDDFSAFPPEEFMAACVQRCFLNGWLDMNAVTAPDSSICRGELLLSAFRTFEIPVYDESLYSGGAKGSDWNNAVRIGAELGLCPAGADPNGIMTRGDAALLLFALMSQHFEIDPPPLLEELTISSSTAADLNDCLLEIDSVPDPILDAFDAAGWEYHLDPGYLQAYGAANNLSCVGLTSYTEERIYVGAASPTVHEFGHFLDWTLEFPAVHELLYQEEAEQALRILGDYSATNSREYFANYFAYWVSNSDHAERMAQLQGVTPKTYSYFSDLEAKGWIS